jgi:hypothetical protein
MQRPVLLVYPPILIFSSHVRMSTKSSLHIKLRNNIEVQHVEVI